MFWLNVAGRPCIVSFRIAIRRLSSRDAVCVYLGTNQSHFVLDMHAGQNTSFFCEPPLLSLLQIFRPLHVASLLTPLHLMEFIDNSCTNNYSITPTKPYFINLPPNTQVPPHYLINIFLYTRFFD